MLITTSSTRAVAAVLMCIGSALLCILAFVFGKFSVWYKAGYIWSTAVVTVGAIAVGLPDKSLYFLTLRTPSCSY